MNFVPKTCYLAFVTLFFLFTSCTADIEPYGGEVPNPNNPSVPSGTSTFKVDFDGRTFTASTTQAIVNSDYVAITGRKSSGEFFQITIPGARTGTYVINPNTPSSNFALAFSQGNGNVPYLAVDDENGAFADFPNYTDTAEIVISSIDVVNKRIVGTFKFTGVKFADNTGTTIETKVFTNGVFNLPYTSDVVAPTGNSFTAKIDGTAYVPTNITGVKTNGLVSVIGRRGNVENIGVVVPEDAAAGSVYNFTALSSDARGQYILDSTPEGIYGGSGSVTIISHNVTAKRIKGTFSFVATSMIGGGSVNITDGTFDITYL
jgi:hypothetical protein